VILPPVSKKDEEEINKSEGKDKPEEVVASNEGKAASNQQAAEEIGGKGVAKRVVYKQGVGGGERGSVGKGGHIA